MDRLIEKEKKWREEAEVEAEKHFIETGWAPTEGHVLNFIAGYVSALKAAQVETGYWKKNSEYFDQCSREKDQVISNLDEEIQSIKEQLKQKDDDLKLALDALARENNDNEELHSLIAQARQLFHSTSMWTQNEEVRKFLEETKDIGGEK